MQETQAYATATMLLHTTGNQHHMQSHYIWPYRLRLFQLIMERSNRFPEKWLSPHNHHTRPNRCVGGDSGHSSSRDASDCEQKSFLLHL